MIRLDGEHLEPLQPESATAALEAGLAAFSYELAAAMVGSAEVGAAFALVLHQRWADPSADEDVRTDPIEAVLAARLESLAAAGLLDISDATVAARQLGALTVLLAYDDQPKPGHVDLGRVESTTTAGVRTFTRAFGA